MTIKTSIPVEELLKDPVVREVTDNINPEHVKRNRFKPRVCEAFSHTLTRLVESGEFLFDIDREARVQLPGIIDNKVQKIIAARNVDEAFRSNYLKKRKIGIVFSGGPAPGGHNVIAGLFDAMKVANPKSELYGFLMGPDGIIENEQILLTPEIVDKYRNLGGFGMIKTGRAKIDTEGKMAMSRETCKSLGLDALVVVGGDDSNTNAAFLAQEMIRDGIQVIGVPKTIDGDIQVRDANGNVLCAISFGFHSAARSFSNCINNLCTDGSSDVKYWHVCKVMGRVASHLGLETALQTHANMTLIGEDLADYVDKERLAKAEKKGTIDFTAYGMTLRHLSRIVCDAIVRRARVGKNYGVLIVPEGVLEFINEIQHFIIKLNTIIAEYNETHDKDFHQAFPRLEDKLEYLRHLARISFDENAVNIWNARDDDLFNDIPSFFQEGLLTERDTHGNFQFSLVQTEKVLMGLVKDYLGILKEQGVYKVGIDRKWYEQTLLKDGLDPDALGPVLFRNFGSTEHLLVRPEVISVKTLKQALIDGNVIQGDQDIPKAVRRVFDRSNPKFKTQEHFYGYDGRGSAPTKFDCNYTYNLGLTVFSLVANGSTGQMAAIKNLEKDFSKWQPLGIPIAPLMHLEERKGKLSLVIEKSVVDVNSNALKVVKALREKWLAASPGDDCFRNPGPIRFDGDTEEERPITLTLNAVGH